MSAVDATLAERGRRYGEFVDRARLSQNLKLAMLAGPGWSRLAADQREALEMIASKISRILCGDAGHTDSWHDIAGYARLVEQRLEGAR